MGLREETEGKERERGGKRNKMSKRIRMVEAKHGKAPALFRVFVQRTQLFLGGCPGKEGGLEEEVVKKKKKLN